jgi:hypothetical protein
VSRFLSTFLATVAELDALDKSDELCCVFQRDWSRRMYGDYAVSIADHRLWNLWPVMKDPWGPITACFLAGIAEPGSRRDDGQLTPDRMHRCQGWRDKLFGASGHTISALAGPAGTGWAIVFDSAKDPRNARATLVVWDDYRAQYKAGFVSCVLREV